MEEEIEEIEDIVIKEVKEVTIDPKEKEKWDQFNLAWRERLKEKKNANMEK